MLAAPCDSFPVFFGKTPSRSTCIYHLLSCFFFRRWWLLLLALETVHAVAVKETHVLVLHSVTAVPRTAGKFSYIHLERCTYELYVRCGSTSAYCSTGCQPRFGDCKKLAPASSTRTSTRSSSTGFRTVPIASRISSSRPAATQSVSTNARCGPAFGGKTCLGSRWGNCCSQ
jgi:hypothetical protein